LSSSSSLSNVIRRQTLLHPMMMSSTNGKFDITNHFKPLFYQLLVLMQSRNSVSISYFNYGLNVFPGGARSLLDCRGFRGRRWQQPLSFHTGGRQSTAQPMAVRGRYATVCSPPFIQPPLLKILDPPLLLDAAYEWHNIISCAWLMFVVVLKMNFVDIKPLGGLPI